VETERPYQVWIGRDLLKGIGKSVSALHGPCSLALVTDETVDPLYGGMTAKSLARAGFRVVRHVVPPGEGSKSMARLSLLLESLAEEKFTGADLIVALGGGVVGDLAGFAAAVYERGIAYIQVPTTLLAAVDSSVGGKTAVNLPAGKNLAGAFWQPKMVLCDCGTFSSLPRKELASGGAECLKYGMLGDEALFQRLGGGLYSPWEDIVAPCVSQKARIVGRDETDQGPRRLLNFGHTAGHAAERLSGYTLRHGEAVGLGMLIITRAAEAMGLCAPGVAEKIESALRAMNLPARCPYSSRQLAQAALGDKKRRGDEITLVMPRRVGECFLYPVEAGRLPEIFSLGLEGSPCA
jgi:3-dehydroquinate synthase